MQININGEVFDVSGEVLTNMLDFMEKTSNDGHERGFLLCDTPKGITPGKKCTGNKCSIKLEDCKGWPTIGTFHTHPQVTSFSQSDYLNAFQRATEHPEHKHLLCVSLLNKGIRCKALKKLPPPGQKFPVWDSDANRGMVKPYFTKKVSISPEQINELLKGTSWEDLPPAETIVAIDEGKGVKAVPKKDLRPTQKTYDELIGNLQTIHKKATAPKYKTVVVQGKLAMEPISTSEILSPEPTWVDITDIETPDPDLIAPGEVLGYAKGMTPIQLLEEKVNGKWKIWDGRHRLSAFATSGYKIAPVVFVKPSGESL